MTTSTPFSPESTHPLTNISYRTDRHNNPIAITTQVAAQAGLVKGKDYEDGEEFTSAEQTYRTARFLKDPVFTSLKVIDAIGFYTKTGRLRWNYIGIPEKIWKSLARWDQIDVIHFMYKREGGKLLEPLFDKAKTNSLRLNNV